MFVIPVTYKLLATPCRAMDEDFPYALRKHIPVLPIVMEPGIDQFYSQRDKFGDLQYLYPYSTDSTEISYEEKLKRFLDSVLIGDEMVQRIRDAFDAYIFLSYRKKDRQYANQLMQMIHRTPKCRDIAIWFDEFLAPGENFRKNIEKMLHSSEMFALLVTPNLLEEPGGNANFVMGEEYPAAQSLGMKILPVEMERTDIRTLSVKFPGISKCVDAQDQEAFEERLLTAIENIAVTSNGDDPEHSFLIGLAYLNGIDVEVDRQRAVEMISFAADAELPEAMEQLYNMYDSGHGVDRDYAKAIEWAETLVKYYQHKYGDEHERTLLWLQNAAYTSQLAGDSQKALKIFQEMFPLACTVFGEEHQNTFTVRHNLALCYLGVGDKTKAAELIEQSYLLRRKSLGENHVDTISSLTALANVWDSLEDLERALKLGQEAYQRGCQALGEEHPVTIEALHAVAYTYGNLKKYQQALSLFEKAYKLLCKTVGERHPNAMTALSNIAYIYSCEGNNQESLKLNETIYMRSCEVLGEGHTSTIYTLNNLAFAYGNIGDNETALRLQEKAYMLFCKAFGDEHPDAITSLENQVILYLCMGEYKRALPIEEKVCALRNKVLGTEAASTQESLAILNAIREKVQGTV